MVIRIGGVPGSGKTSIISHIENISGKLNLPVEIVKGSEILMQVLGVSSREQLQAIPESVRSEARPEMFRRLDEIAREHPDKIFLRDAHYSLIQDGHVIYFPVQAGDRDTIFSMVCIDAPAEVIKERRIQDEMRSDRALILDEIRLELDTEIGTASKQASSLGKDLMVISNAGVLEYACFELIERAFPLGYAKNTLLHAYNKGHSGIERR